MAITTATAPAPRALTSTRTERDALHDACEAELYAIDGDIKSRANWLRARAAGEIFEQIGWERDDDRHSFTVTADTAWLTTFAAAARQANAEFAEDQVRNIKRARAGDEDYMVGDGDLAATEAQVARCVDDALGWIRGCDRLLARLEAVPA
jgi:hypothetical protein